MTLSESETRLRSSPKIYTTHLFCGVRGVQSQVLDSISCLLQYKYTNIEILNILHRMFHGLFPQGQLLAHMKFLIAIWGCFGVNFLIYGNGSVHLNLQHLGTRMRNERAGGNRPRILRVVAST